MNWWGNGINENNSEVINENRLQKQFSKKRLRQCRQEFLKSVLHIVGRDSQDEGLHSVANIRSSAPFWKLFPRVRMF